MVGRNAGNFRDVKQFIVVVLGAAAGLGYLIATLVLGTKRVESMLELSWAVVAALAAVVLLTLL